MHLFSRKYACTYARKKGQNMQQYAIILELHTGRDLAARPGPALPGFRPARPEKAYKFFGPKRPEKSKKFSSAIYEKFIRNSKNSINYLKIRRKFVISNFNNSWKGT